MIDADKIIKAISDNIPTSIKDAKIKAQAAMAAINKDDNSRATAIGVGAAGLLGAILLSGGNFGRNIARLGGMAALGTLAYQAWQKQGGAIGSEPAFLPQAPAQKEAVGKAILRAMIAAMKADGTVSAEERTKLFDHLSNANLSDEEKAFLFEELARPLDIDAVALDATTPELATQIYAASLVAINPDGPAEKVYLAQLAAKLKLDGPMIDAINAEAVAAEA